MSKVRKALMAGALAGLTAAGTALLNGGSITPADWGVIVGAAVAAGLAVWRVPNATVNAPKAGIHR